MADQPHQPGTYDAGDPVQVQDAKTKAGRRAKADADVIRLILHKKEGRAWMWAKLEACHAFRPSYIPEAGMQPMDVAYNEGLRSMGLLLLAEVMNASSDLYLLARKEAMEE